MTSVPEFPARLVLLSRKVPGDVGRARDLDFRLAERHMTRTSKELRETTAPIRSSLGQDFMVFHHAPMGGSGAQDFNDFHQFVTKEIVASATLFRVRGGKDS